MWHPSDPIWTTRLDKGVEFVIPFDLPYPNVVVYKFAPEFVADAAGNILAVHQGWSALVSANSPARSRGVLHVYAVGLGDTSPPVGYGLAAPASEPLARHATPIYRRPSSFTAYKRIRQCGVITSQAVQVT